MAGNYTDAPAPRILYDRDGTIGVHINNSGPTVISELSTGSLQTVNNESSNGFNVATGNDNKSLVLIFPFLYDVVSYASRISLVGVGASFNAFQYSSNTTNGIDGNWTTIHTLNSTSFLGLRQNIVDINISGVKALKINASRGGGSGAAALLNFHIYGGIALGQNDDRLRMWHPTLDQPLDTNDSTSGSHLDWGDVVRGTSADKTFRIKNQSSTLTANSIAISTEVLTNTSPDIASQITYSSGGAFSTSINIGNLAPGGISPLITVRKITLSNATLSLWWLRTLAEATSWS